ncbi:unnamed protein product [Owenia fusiformis]|uniref:Sorbitol dehydrogenase n=1 Tax=Owenia fusiformis TaxID=6347 RepID=A0A8J1TXD3_OWEFU|nr:unnamed protein product [Owenia fusiformis]
MEMAGHAPNIAAILHGKDDLRLEPYTTVAPGDNEVLLEMGSVGICGSDLKYWKYGKCGRFTVTDPMVIGHEGSGVVAKIGTGVTTLKPGDRVAIEPGVPCRVCKLCKTGRYNICPDVKFCATPPVHGNLCKYYTHPADFCFKLPENVSLDAGALVEPLAVAVYGCERGGVKVGTNVLICGAGPVGLLCIMVARAMGASTIAITDIDDHRLQTAKDLGADHVIKVLTNDCEAMADEIVKAMGECPDVALECSGADSSVVTGIHACQPGGSVVLIGRGSMMPQLPLVAAASKEVDIKGVFRYANCYPKAIDLLRNGSINVDKLITHHFNLKDSTMAFKTAMDRDAKAIKVMIHCDK